MDKQMIEEMAKLEIEESEGFYSAYINDMRISKNKPLGKSKTFMTFKCPKKYILNAIGIPENVVVLTEEEYERWQGQTLNIKKVRNETVDKFAERLKYEVDFIPNHLFCVYEVKDAITKIAKKIKEGKV